VQKKRATSFAQALKMKLPDVLGSGQSDEDMYPLALAVARRQMKLWWDTPPLHRQPARISLTYA